MRVLHVLHFIRLFLFFFSSQNKLYEIVDEFGHIRLEEREKKNDQNEKKRKGQKMALRIDVDCRVLGTNLQFLIVGGQTCNLIASCAKILLFLRWVAVS